jgi:hypothetical protein
MLRVRKYLPHIMAAVIGAAILGAPSQAQASLRLTVSDGSTTQVFYNQGNGLAVLNNSIGQYTFTAHLVSTNFPGGTVGSLTQSVQFATAGSGAIPNLTLTAAVIVDLGASPTTAQITGAALAPFANPTPGPWRVTTDVNGTVGQSVTSGQADGTTTVNGTPVSVSNVSIPGIAESMNFAIVSTPPLSSYTLTNQLVLRGLNNGIQQGDVSVQLSSSVIATSVPEPATLAGACVGLFSLGLVKLRRRKTTAIAV